MVGLCEEGVEYALLKSLCCFSCCRFSSLQHVAPELLDISSNREMHRSAPRNEQRTHRHICRHGRLPSDLENNTPYLFATINLHCKLPKYLAIPANAAHLHPLSPSPSCCTSRHARTLRDFYLETTMCFPCASSPSSIPLLSSAPASRGGRVCRASPGSRTADRR